MKPIKLEMTAFGSYAQPATVDFRELEHCLYLITGDTGAGKTTIFDGIMFALYGVASGKGDKKYRTFEMMHCDYVDKSEDTIIKLDFEHMGSVYTVERKFHFIKKRDTKEYADGTTQAKLWEPDKDVLDQPKAVTTRITELLGMNAEQFRKIVMLAQGEFRKFLDADSEEKNQILGELFDNSAYVRFQEIFDRARKKLALRRKEEGTVKIQSAMENFMMPEGISEEELEVFTAGHSGLEKALEKLVERSKMEQEELEKQSKACRDKENELREKLGEAKMQNNKLDEFDKKRKALQDLQKKEPDIEQLKEKNARVERAIYKVKPKYELFKSAKEICRKTNIKIQNLSEQLVELKKKKQETKKQLDNCEEENKSKIEKLGNDILEIAKSLPQYLDLEEKSKELQREGKAEEEARKNRVEAETSKEQTEQRLDELKKQQKELDGSDTTEQQRAQDLKDIIDNLNKLTAKSDGIEAQVNKAHRQEDDLRSKKEALKELLEEVRKLESIYHNTYQAFIQGQAGLLARNLEQELQEKKEAVCPVCRTAFQNSVPHCFAEFVEGTPEQEDVDKAKADYESKDNKRQKSSVEIRECETELKGLKETIISRLRELKPDCPDWEVLDKTSYLDETIRKYKVQKENAEKKYKEAKDRCDNLKKVKEEIDEKEEKLKDYNTSLDGYRKAEQKHKNQCNVLEAEINQLKKNLNYSDKKTAEDTKAALETEKGQCEEKIRIAEQTYQNVEKDYNSISGQLKSAKDTKEALEKDREKKENELQTEIKEQGFQDMEEVDKLLKEVGETDAERESWIKSKNKEITDFRKKLESTQDRIKELEDETKNFERTDLAQLNNKINSKKEEHEEIQGKLDKCKKQHENHSETAKAVQKANQILKDTEVTWKRLNSLADLATGVSSEGGKLSFDRYVMGYVFREVLDMANQRLDIMSGGRYELIHERSANKKSAKAGLEITVLDMTTGKRRSVSSLSGGESFFVSLALALGLSDIVQNHAGGRQLDALFIDEGFGTLDNDVLDHALMVLNQLTEGQRLVGIISHVAKLEESIPQQIRVKNSENGSTLKIVI